MLKWLKLEKIIMTKLESYHDLYFIENTTMVTNYTKEIKKVFKQCYFKGEQ